MEGFLSSYQVSMLFSEREFCVYDQISRLPLWGCARDGSIFIVIPSPEVIFRDEESVITIRFLAALEMEDFLQSHSK